MDDIDYPSNKTFGKKTSNVKNKDLAFPIKKCHLFDGKHFIVIDRTITEKLNYFDTKTVELYFQQEVTEDGCIILRPFRMSE